MWRGLAARRSSTLVATAAVHTTPSTAGPLNLLPEELPLSLLALLLLKKSPPDLCLTPDGPQLLLPGPGRASEHVPARYPKHGVKLFNFIKASFFKASFCRVPPQKPCALVWVFCSQGELILITEGTLMQDVAFNSVHKLRTLKKNLLKKVQV